MRFSLSYTLQPYSHQPAIPAIHPSLHQAIKSATVRLLSVLWGFVVVNFLFLWPSTSSCLGKSVFGGNVNEHKTRARIIVYGLFLYLWPQLEQDSMFSMKRIWIFALQICPFSYCLTFLTSYLSYADLL